MNLPSNIKRLLLPIILTGSFFNAAAAEDANQAAKAPEITISRQKELAKERMQKDTDKFSQEQLREIETLYQSANKNLKAPEAKGMLEQLVSKYGGSNRAGCGILYLCKMTQGEEQIKYLSEAIDKYSDCYYGDGVQVGPYAKFYLAKRYQHDKRNDKAQALYKEIGTLYPDAVTHGGTLLLSSLRQAK